MNEPASVAPVSRRAGGPARQEARDFLFFLVKLLLAVLLIRGFLVAPFSIPSESMQPRLLVGDYLLAAKWPYGWSRWSLPFGAPPIEGRAFGRLPARGDVVIFRAPPDDARDYIKRVIGLPGDSVQVRDGQLILNGTAVPRDRIADFVHPVSPNSPCFSGAFTDREPGGALFCRYPRYRETLPGGRAYDVLDLGDTAADHTRVYTVPAGQLFLMGDNRDRSADSRFSAVAGGGIGFVPVDKLIGRALVSVYSTDGSAAWSKPWTWLAAARRTRIGERF